jgi:hypothetical protein
MPRSPRREAVSNSQRNNGQYQSETRQLSALGLAILLAGETIIGGLAAIFFLFFSDNGRAIGSVLPRKPTGVLFRYRKRQYRSASECSTSTSSHFTRHGLYTRTPLDEPLHSSDALLTGTFFPLGPLIAKKSSIRFGISPITIIVSYSPWRMPWTSTKEFRFVTKQHSDGKTYWMPIPLNR